MNDEYQFLSMRIIVDNKIPYIKEGLELITKDVIFLPAKEITPQTVENADALIIRTRTRCNSELLGGSKVKFIGTATIGFDHIDVDFCKAHAIRWINAPGCNSGAVEQYLRSTLLLLQKEKKLELKNSTLGIVGVGHVGSRVATVAKSLGMKVLLNDPPRENKGEKGFVTIEEIAYEADVITFHTPLIKEGIYKTYHLADNNFFDSLKKSPYIINTSRGEVIETSSILNAIEMNKISDAVIDVWENEPNINAKLLDRVYIGTPHIAGYSADGKANATRMILDELFSFYGIDKKAEINLKESPFNKDKEYYMNDYNYLEVYNPLEDTEVLKNNIKRFESLRGDYCLRREL